AGALAAGWINAGVIKRRARPGPGSKVPDIHCAPGVRGRSRGTWARRPGLGKGARILLNRPDFSKGCRLPPARILSHSKIMAGGRPGHRVPRLLAAIRRAGAAGAACN